jgi:hypothetical protein
MPAVSRRADFAVDSVGAMRRRHFELGLRPSDGACSTRLSVVSFRVHSEDAILARSPRHPFRVPVATIVQSIRSATKIQFFQEKRDYERLVQAGASTSETDQIMKAIHAREYNGIDLTPAPETAPVAVAPAPVKAPPMPVSLPPPPPAPVAPAPVSVAVVAPAPPPAPAPVVTPVEVPLPPAPPVQAVVVSPVAPVAPAMVTTVPIARHVTLEDGTPVKLRLARNLSSADATKGETVDFEVLEKVKIGEQIVISKGSFALGTVTEAQEKRRMGRGGKLDVVLDNVHLADGEKVAIRGVKDTKGGGHVGAVTVGIVATSLVFWPAAPLFLLMHGKDINIPKGTEITAYVNGNMTLDPAKF